MDMSAKLASLAAETKKKFKIQGDVDLFRADAEELDDLQDSLLANRLGPNECLVVAKGVDDASRNPGKESTSIEKTCRIAGDQFLWSMTVAQAVGGGAFNVNEVTKIIGTESAPCVQNIENAPAQALMGCSQNSVYEDPGVIECCSVKTTSNSSEMCRDLPTEIRINVLGARHSDIPCQLEAISLEPTATVGELVRSVKENAEEAFSCKSLEVSEIIPFSDSCSFLDQLIPFSNPLWHTNHPRAVGLSDDCWILVYIQSQGVHDMDIRARLEAIWPIPEATQPACCKVPGLQAVQLPNLNAPNMVVYPCQWSAMAAPSHLVAACMPLPVATMTPFAAAGYPPFGFAMPSQCSDAPLKVPVRPAMVLVLVQNDPLLAGMAKVSGRPDGVHHLVSRGRHGGWNHLIFYKMDGRKLKSDDQQATSKEFDLPIGKEGAGVPFMLIIHPKMAYQAKGGRSFKKSKGVCTAEVKCNQPEALQDECSNLEYYLSVGPEMSEKQQAPRGPFAHNFLENTTAQLPKGNDGKSDQWNLQAAVGKDGKLIVALEVLNLKFKGGKEEV